LPSGGARSIVVTMNDAHPSPGAGISRRHLIAGLGAASGAAGLLASLPGGSVVAGPVAPALAGGPGGLPQVLVPPSSDLSYIGIDSFGFSTPGNDRYSDDTSGTGALMPPDVIVAPLSLPAGSVVRQLNVAYIGTPGVQLWRRRLATPQDLSPTNPPAAVFDQPAPDQGGGPRAHSFDTDITIAADSTYSLRMPVEAGESIFGVTIGYEAPSPATGALGIVPIDPPTRPLDTRQPGPQQGKLAAGEERVVQLGLPDGAAGAIINLTITQTETTFGYVSVYRAGIAWPGNSSINWSSPELTAANGVITAVDDQGRITIRGGEAATHVVIDLVGALI
jgi:hypothetical protein